MYVNQSMASLWAEPVETEKTDEALYGMRAEVLCTEGEWSHVRMFYGYEGWLKSDYLSEEVKIPEGIQRCVTVAWADVMAEPSVSAKVKITLPRGSVVTVCEEGSGEWEQVTLWDGSVGFVPFHFLQPFSKPAEEEWKAKEILIRQEILASAFSYMGTQYRWGGKTPAGIDCSGLAQMAYLMSGIVIYRDAKLLPGYAVHEIDPLEKKMGDLLYFTGHMGIYLGGGRYIHATTKSGCHHVTVNSLEPKTNDYRADLAEKFEKAGSIF